MERQGPLEILAPVGSAEMLEAAVRCGADAVYMGASAFHARQHSHSFTDEELKQAVAYCHGHGTAVHLTLNTLIRQEEMPAALKVARTAWLAGVDALIVQDVGLARQIHAASPDLPLHASTQLSCHTPEGVRRLRDSGFSRVVLAREMTSEEIAACAGLGCELEMFVHGALCMCVSGQCYLSAMLGGRSGNRGLCAQPCRLPFRPDQSRDPSCAALSLKDLCLLEYMAALPALGVCSLKIEGRMKRPEYVAAAVTVYRAASRGEQPDPQTVADLKAVFSRCGFTDGYFTGKRQNMFGVRRKEDVQAASPVLGRLRRLYAAEVPRIPADLSLQVASGEPVRLTVADRQGNRVQVTGGYPERAINRALDRERAVAQLKKTGGTPFLAGRVAAEVEAGLTVPLAALNSLRRQGLDRLLEIRSRPPVRLWQDNPGLATPPPMQRCEGGPALLARFADEAKVPPDGGLADGLILPWDTPPDRLFYWQVRKPTAVAVPRGLFGREDEVLAGLQQARKAGIGYALCGNIGGVGLALKSGLKPIGDFSLNIANRQAMDFYAGMGAYAAVVSMELTFRQMEFARQASIPAGLLVYGRQALMLTRNCPRTGGNLCTKKACGGSLTDRRGKVFPLQCDGGCVELLNADRLYWADRLKELPSLDFWLLSFTNESRSEAEEILRWYRTGGPVLEGITRGLYRRGVE